MRSNGLRNIFRFTQSFSRHGIIKAALCCCSFGLTKRFDPTVLKTIAKWKKSNPILFKKLSKLLKDIMLHPREGLGHPEPLVGGNNILYSRRLSAHDRIIYEIYDDKILVLVIDVEGHYDDK